MGEASKIEWTDATFNPWIGCTKVSPACDNCYAEDYARRYKIADWGNHPRHKTGASTWSVPRRLNRDADTWFAQYGRPRFIFCASLADVFDNQVPAEWRRELWDLIRDCDRLVWLLLTKRPQNIRKMLPSDWGEGWSHVWLGATVENQVEAQKRLIHLMSVPAAKRFVSCEPLTGPLDLSEVWPDSDTKIDFIRGHCEVEDIIEGWQPSEWCPDQLDWVITGGESGANARSAPEEWYLDLRDQCFLAGVPFHFKQWGEFDAAGKRVGKKKAGRILDGQTWDERPQAA